MSAAKKYQVFVSSTYGDLKEERSKVIQALWELNCIPIAMEMFPASDSTAWQTITKMIDDCDYYILILKGRYGSIDPESGIGFTEKEFHYACANGIPVSSFLFGNPKTLPPLETDEKEELEHTGGATKKDLLKKFRDHVKDQKTCKFWNNGDELKAQVVLAIHHAINNDTRHGVGWVRASEETDPSAVLELHGEIKELKAELEKARESGTKPPPMKEIDWNPHHEIDFAYEVDGKGTSQKIEIWSILPILATRLTKGVDAIEVSEILTDIAREMSALDTRSLVRIYINTRETVLSLLQVMGIIIRKDVSLYSLLSKEGPNSNAKYFYTFTQEGERTYIRMMAGLQ